MTRRRVVVTGLGQVSAAGEDLDRFWSWISAPTPAPVSTPVAGFDPRDRMTVKQVRRSDPFAQYAIAAADLALKDASLDPGTVPPRRGGVVLSTAYGALETVQAEMRILETQGPDEVTPSFTVVACENIAGSMVSERLGWRGPCRTVMTACAGGAHAVADGTDLIRSGRCDVVIAGGTQGPFIEALLVAYRNLRVLSASGWLRPFDRRREGFVFAEGAATLVLEDLDAARARGARIYAEVLGAGSTNDAASMVAPTGPGAAECIEDALADAGLDPSEIGHVSAHGTGTLLGDEREAATLHQVFGSPPPVTSIKRTLGHAAGAAGAFGALTSVLSVHHGLMPSLGDDVVADDDLDLDLVTGPPRPFEPAPVLSNSFGLGGVNGCLVVGPVR